LADTTSLHQILSEIARYANSDDNFQDSGSSDDAGVQFSTKTEAQQLLTYFEVSTLVGWVTNLQ
jgi:hypothetical protein